MHKPLSTNARISTNCKLPEQHPLLYCASSCTLKSSLRLMLSSPLEETSITTIPCLSRKSGIRANNVLLLASPIRSLSCSLTSCAPTASISLELKRRVVQAAKEHLVVRQSLELLRLHFLRLVLRIREGLYNALHARRRWYFAIGQANSFNAFLHLSGFWLPPLSSVSELHLAAGELACSLVAACKNYSQCFRAGVVFQTIVLVGYDHCTLNRCMKASVSSSEQRRTSSERCLQGQKAQARQSWRTRMAQWRIPLRE